MNRYINKYIAKAFLVLGFTVFCAAFIIMFNAPLEDEEFSVWVALLVAALMLAGALLTVAGIRCLSGELTFFKRMHSNGELVNVWTVAAMHRSWSLTWSWILRYYPDDRRWKFYLYRIYGYQGWFYFSCGASLGWFGGFGFTRQPTMRK